MAERLLETRALAKRFGGLNALSGVDFHIDKGEIVSIIGPNGAGKTTFFNCISGMFAPDTGDAIYKGQSIAGLSPDQITKLGIARTFQNVRLFPNMTVLENVMVGRHCRTHKSILPTIFRSPGFIAEEKAIEERAKEILSFFGKRLHGYRWQQPAYVLSYANRRRLEIARAMATDPEVLLLDEPTAGMNPRESMELTELIGQLRDEWGYTIIMIEHDMKVVRDVSDRVVVLDHGVKLTEGTYEEVSTNPQVIEAYLGKTELG
ncbi:MAG: ABC transporter ATP-binding protein [Actinomycetes bacterium]|jgi:branched-chain amino acid transport system ATP-binding protein|nr:MAG: ABC transporter ATP-binding protein [Actinomycetota bacterium]